VKTGTSALVERAVTASPRRGEVEKRRRYRRAYLSRYGMRLAMDAPLATSVVSRAAYAGDLQMHSTWSDGVESIADLAEGAIELGWTRIGVTDHSYGLPIARGMSMDAARRQHHEIDALNQRLAGRLRSHAGRGVAARRRHPRSSARTDVQQPPGRHRRLAHGLPRSRRARRRD
jgi:hypothetical protein